MKANVYQYDTGLFVQWACEDCRKPREGDLPTYGDPFSRMKAYGDLK